MSVDPIANDDTELALAEARNFDLEHQRPAPHSASRGGDPALLTNLCRALEREAASGLADLEQRDLIGLRGSLEMMMQQIEELLKRR